MMVSTRGIKVDFAPGECVLCFEPDLSKARVLYDAKVIDVVTSKNRQGNRRIEYLVHFQGWNNSWDRVVPSSFVVKGSDRNRRLMKKLAEVARRVKKNRARMRRIDKILKEHFQERPKFDSDSSSSDSSEDTDEEDVVENGTGETEESDTATEDEGQTFCRQEVAPEKLESESEEEKDAIPLECTDPKEVLLDLPGNLRRKLEQDCIMINRKDKLISLPAEPNIITVLEGYVKNFGVNILCATVEKQKPYTLREQRVELPEKNIDLCKEMMDGLRIFFDFALPTILLYGSEREQYERLQATRKSLVNLKKEPKDTKPVLQSPRLNSSKSDMSPAAEPPSKVPRLSPRVTKKELSDFSDDDYGPPRRITRKAFQEEVRRSSLKNSDSAKKSKEKEAPDNVEATPESKRRGSTCPKPDTKSPAKSLRSSKKAEKTVRNGRDRSQKVLTDRVSPPPSLLLLPGSISSSSSNAETPTSSMEQSLFQHREAAVNEIFSWKMLPDGEYERIPNPASLVYGAHHLLRLFVKLPESMEKMPIPPARLKAMIKHLEQFIQYLSSRADEFFPESAYVDADDTFGWKDL